MSFTLEFEVEVEELGRTFTVEATCERGEAACINHMNPENAHPGSAPNVESCRVLDENGDEVDDVFLKDVFIAKKRDDLEWVDGQAQFKTGPRLCGIHPYAGYGRTYMKNNRGEVLELTSLERYFDEAADAHLEEVGEPEHE